MQRKTKILTAGLMAGVGLLAVAAVVGHHGDGAFARGMDHAGGWHKGDHHGWRGNKARGQHGKRGGVRRMLKRLKRMDADNNGEVTQAEFLQRRQERFAALDGDKSNTLTAEELVSPMNERREWRGKRMIKRFDANNDGKVTKDEMLAIARTRFAERDLDGDGEITKKDRPPKKSWRKGRAGDEEGSGDAERKAGTEDGDKAQGEDRAEGRRHHGRKHGRRHRRTLKQVEERVTRRFERRDTNKDGAIDLSEITNRNQEREDFEKRRRMHRLDSDKDGVISQDEFLKKARDRFAIWDLDDSGAITADDLPATLAQRWQKK